jgi:hypothetical protein
MSERFVIDAEIAARVRVLDRYTTLVRSLAQGKEAARWKMRIANALFFSGMLATGLSLIVRSTPYSALASMLGAVVALLSTGWSLWSSFASVHLYSHDLRWALRHHRAELHDALALSDLNVMAEYSRRELEAAIGDARRVLERYEPIIAPIIAELDRESAPRVETATPPPSKARWDQPVPHGRAP